MKIEITQEDFQKMIKEIQDLKIQIHKLEQANAFLNTEIEKYNQDFASKS